MELNNLHELLTDNLKDIFNAENQLLKALPKMSKSAKSPSLRQAFETHIGETERQVKRLRQIADIMGLKLEGKKCKAMEGLIEEGREILDSDGEGIVIDLGLIGAAQRVEHYEISAYGTARTFAERLGLGDVADLLQESLDEEAAADKTLTQISETELLIRSPRSRPKGTSRAETTRAGRQAGDDGATEKKPRVSSPSLEKGKKPVKTKAARRTH